jgi:transposase InsO family protein
MLTLINEYTRECLAVEVGVSLKSERVRQILQRVCADKGLPEMIRSDNGSEFIGKAVGNWLTQSSIEPLFIAPDKPWQNGKAKALTES